MNYSVLTTYITDYCTYNLLINCLAKSGKRKFVYKSEKGIVKHRFIDFKQTVASKFLQSIPFGSNSSVV